MLFYLDIGGKRAYNRRETEGVFLRSETLLQQLEEFPIIAAIRSDRWERAILSPAQVLFLLDANILTVRDRISQAHNAGKTLLVHMDLTEGIGKDRSGLQFLRDCGVDGIISTKAPIIRMAKELELITIQRFFALDSQGMGSVHEMLRQTNPHFIEIMPGVIPKILQNFSNGPLPVIAGGLIETKGEITAALNSGATAISTGAPKLWEL